MELALLKIFCFLRPIMFADIPLKVFGLGFFELATFLTTALLALIPIGQVALRTSRPWHAEHIAALAFISWCTAAFLLYRGDSDLQLYLKWVLPWILMFVFVSAVQDEHAWAGAVKWLLIGFPLPIWASAYMTLTGQGLAQEIYWTKLDRYRGVYDNIHNMGHNMGLFLMLVAIYIVFRAGQHGGIRNAYAREKILWSVILATSFPALYCLYHSQVRTVYLGLVAFVIAWSLLGKRYLTTLMILGTGALIYVAAPVVHVIFFDVVDAAEGQTDIEKAGSGRPAIWMHNLELFADAPLDRQIGGFGVGNYGYSLGGRSLGTNIWNSHNDYLDTMMQTGIVGLVLMLALYGIIGYRIWNYPGPARNVLLAFYTAVVLMNLASNSYINRFGLAQAFLVIASLAMTPRAVEGLAAAESPRPTEGPRKPNPVRARPPAAVPGGRALVGRPMARKSRGLGRA